MAHLAGKEKAKVPYLDIASNRYPKYIGLDISSWVHLFRYSRGGNSDHYYRIDSPPNPGMAYSEGLFLETCGLFYKFLFITVGLFCDDLYWSLWSQVDCFIGHIINLGIMCGRDFFCVGDFLLLYRFDVN